MAGHVIQGLFLGGRPRLSAPARGPVAQPKAPPRLANSPAQLLAARPPGPPLPAFGTWPQIAKPKASLGASAPVAQARGTSDAFQVDPGLLGLASSGGRPLPDAVRGHMEAALGADFSGVRVHVGPQAERIGAIAFTTGNDIYFAPGRFQPDTVQGRQLLGHELAHVVQQRQGRVRNSLGATLAVVHDHALEAEADRLGYLAAAMRGSVQRKRATVATRVPNVGITPTMRVGPAGVIVKDHALKTELNNFRLPATMAALSPRATSTAAPKLGRGLGPNQVGQMCVIPRLRTTVPHLSVPVIQRGTKRKTTEPTIDYQVIPSTDHSQYIEHVKTRMKVFIRTMACLMMWLRWQEKMLKIIRKRETKKQGFSNVPRLRRLSSVTANDATLQIGSGMRPKSKKAKTATAPAATASKTYTGPEIDAAHIVNTSIKIEEIFKHVEPYLLDKHKRALVQLAISSGATTMQFQSNNVGPDKIIDKCMTEFRKILTDTQYRNENWSAIIMLTEFSNDCLRALQAKEAEHQNWKPKKDLSGYRAAIEGVQDTYEQRFAIAVDIANDTQIWMSSNFSDGEERIVEDAGSIVSNSSSSNTHLEDID